MEKPGFYRDHSDQILVNQEKTCKILAHMLTTWYTVKKLVEFFKILLSIAVVFNRFHSVAHFSTQSNLTTHFGQQNLISVAKIW